MAACLGSGDHKCSGMISPGSTANTANVTYFVQCDITLEKTLKTRKGKKKVSNVDIHLDFRYHFHHFHVTHSLLCDVHFRTASVRLDFVLKCIVCTFV